MIEDQSQWVLTIVTIVIQMILNISTFQIRANFHPKLPHMSLSPFTVEHMPGKDPSPFLYHLSIVFDLKKGDIGQDKINEVSEAETSSLVKNGIKRNRSEAHPTWPLPHLIFSFSKFFPKNICPFAIKAYFKQIWPFVSRARPFLEPFCSDMVISVLNSVLGVKVGKGASSAWNKSISKKVTWVAYAVWKCLGPVCVCFRDKTAVAR